MSEGTAPLPGQDRTLLGLTARQLALILLFLTPAMFSSNILVARATADFIPPVALAEARWGLTFLLLSPFALASLWRHRAAAMKEWLDILILGALGMGICGAFVYIAADTTTATNIGLIYGASPVAIVLLAWACYGERMSALQVTGAGLSLLGVLTIICRGDFTVLRDLRFVVGDLWIVASSSAWAVYSVLLRHRPTALPPMARFAAIVLGGVIVLLPFTLWEAAVEGPPLVTWQSAGAVLLLALVASFGAYQCYGYIQRVLGAGPTSLLMYLIPVYNSLLAFLLLDEALRGYHVAGAALVLPGLYFATRKTGR